MDVLVIFLAQTSSIILLTYLIIIITNVITIHNNKNLTLMDIYYVLRTFSQTIFIK